MNKKQKTHLINQHTNGEKKPQKLIAPRISQPNLQSSGEISIYQKSIATCQVFGRSNPSLTHYLMFYRDMIDANDHLDYLILNMRISEMVIHKSEWVQDTKHSLWTGKMVSHTGNRTRATGVKGRDPNH